MPVPRLTGSDHAIPQAAASQSPGVVAIARDTHAQMSDLIRAYLVRQQNWPATHEQDRRKAATELLKSDVAASRAHIEGPRFARLHASIARRQLDWIWHYSPDCAGPPGESERIAGGPADTGFSARTLWLGGIAFALLAAAIISGLATIQASRPLPFETWARGDLMPTTDSIPGAMTNDALGPGRLVSGPDGSPKDGSGPTAALYEAVAALAGVVAARLEPAAVADPEAGDVDAALGSYPRLEPSDVEIAGLGAILATATAAEELAADLPSSRVSTPMAGAPAERLRPEAPFKPTLVSSLRSEPTELTHPASRR
jgi:hypothetical protein